MMSWLGKVVAGRYLITELIGEGGMGDVYLAYDRQSEAWPEVVLKWLRPGSKNLDRETLERFFVREVAVMRDLSHPNMVRLIDAIRHENHLFLVMERLRGRTLEDRLVAEGPMHWRAALGVMRPIADVLAVLLDANGSIVHRDVKPANIFLAATHQQPMVPKLLDFGIARLSTDVDTTRPVGSLSYLPPEGLSPGRPTEQYDVWSMGVVLYRAIAGRAPFDREDGARTLRAIALDDPEPLQDVPVDVDAYICERMLNKAPVSRPSRSEVASWIASKLVPEVRTVPLYRRRQLVVAMIGAGALGWGGGVLTASGIARTLPVALEMDEDPAYTAPIQVPVPDSSVPGALPETPRLAAEPTLQARARRASSRRPVGPTEPTRATVVFRAADTEGRGTSAVVGFSLHGAGEQAGTYSTPVMIHDLLVPGVTIRMGDVGVELRSVLGVVGPQQVCLRASDSETTGWARPCREP